MGILDFRVNPPESLRIKAKVYVKQTLADNDVGPPAVTEDEPQAMVVTILDVLDEKVDGASLAIVQNGQKRNMVLDARLLFPLAEEGHKIVLTRDYERFVFEPGRNFSNWLSAEALGAVFYRSWHGRKNTSEKAWPQHFKDYGYGDFLLR